MLTPLMLGLLLLQAPEAPKLATLEGTITHAGSKAAIRKAKVTLQPTGSEEPNTVETGDDGKFTLKDIKPGRYRLTASKTGYETTAYGARTPGDALGQSVRVDPGAAIKTLDIGMPRHGAVFGKVLDADSEPVAKSLVIALANTYYQNGRRARLPRGAVPVISNDLGEYRIGELPPGQYVICAIPVGFYQPALGAKESKPGSEEVSVTTCYPNVGQVNEGTQLEIKDATEIPGIDIRLIKSRTVTVQGRITGVPAGAGTITILNLNSKSAGPMGNAIHPRAYVQSAEGKFEFKNVPPGSYILHTLPTGLGSAPFMVKTTIDVGNQPVTDLQVPALIPFEVKAKIKAEPAPDLKLASVRIILTPADEITSAIAKGTASADGDLTLANLVAGRHRVNITGLPPTHYVKEIRAGDQIAESDEIDVIDASTPLTISLASGKGEITGMASNDKGEPVPGATVGLIPSPRRSFRQRIVRTDQSGVFKLSNLPPGDYMMVALDKIEPGALDDEEYIKPIRSKLKKVTVEEGTAQNIDLPVLPVPTSK